MLYSIAKNAQQVAQAKTSALGIQGLIGVRRVALLVGFLAAAGGFLAFSLFRFLEILRGSFIAWDPGYQGALVFYGSLCLLGFLAVYFLARERTWIRVFKIDEMIQQQSQH